MATPSSEENNESSSASRTASGATTVDLVRAGRLPSLPSAFLKGEDRDLLNSIRFLGPDDTFEAPAPHLNRGEIARALASANDAYGHPRARELGEKLAEPTTRVVIAGQQPGILGGPLYTLTKAIAAELWAERLEAQGLPAVALFWVATEDHDFAEVAHATILTGEGPRALELGDDDAPLTPVGMRTLGKGITKVLEEARNLVPGERYSRWIDRIGSWYRPDARFGEAFSRLMVDLLREACPLLVDSMLPALKQAQRPWLERFVDERESIERALSEQEARIEDRGHSLQVAPQPGTSPLFMIRAGERRRISWEGDRFSLRGSEEAGRSIDELRAAISENPAAVSPGVLARPVLQDAVFGTALTLLGPGEVSYYPQVAPLYELLGVRAPSISLRPQVLVLETHQLEKLRAAGVALEELLHPDFDLDRALGRERGERIVAPLRSKIDALIEELRQPALDVDPNLERPWEKTRDSIHRSVETFEKKLTASIARQDEVRKHRLEDLLSVSLPFGSLQERVIASAHFPGKYGEAFVARLLEEMTLDSGLLQVVLPTLEE
ncbi:MAG TPA: bacillithiol biosynthesis cysteine-adding enzyme BshC [Thermoanaerobaculia bacterium]|nr:bacillithiol biosynthesis cysteine-adding enzyme BshC [Thermoanaerobaculia bacterium]